MGDLETGARAVSFFNFPTWANKALGEKPEPAKVQQMPAPTLDEIDQILAAPPVPAPVERRGRAPGSKNKPKAG